MIITPRNIVLYTDIRRMYHLLSDVVKTKVFIYTITFPKLEIISRPDGFKRDVV